MFVLILCQFIIYFPVGYLFLNNRIKSFHFFEKFSLCVTLGLITDMIILSIIGIIYVGYEVLISITVIAYGLILIPKIFKITRETKEKTISGYSNNNFLLREKLHFVRKLKTVNRGLLQDLIPVLVLLLVVGHFSLIGDYIGWPTGYDAINSGFLTSLINYNHKLETNLSPISPAEPWFEPFGFPLMSSNLSLLFNIFPGESVLVLATTIIILILLLVYVAVFRLTKSSSLAVMALFSGFYIYPITNDIRFLEKWLIGYYYNTPYPTLFGYLAVLQFIVLQFTIPKELGARFLSKLSTAILLLGIGLAYTPFIILPIVYIVFAYLGKKVFPDILLFVRRLKTKSVNKNVLSHAIFERKSWYRVIILVTIPIIFYIIFTPNTSTIDLGKFSTLIQRIQTNSYYYSGIVLNPDIFDNLTGIWTVITSIIAIISLIKHNRVNLTVFYLMLSTPILITASLGNLFGDVTWFLFPGRLFAFLIIFDWIMLAIYINDILIRIVKKSLNTEFTLSLARISISLSLITVFFLPSLLSHLTLEQADSWDWWSGRDVFKNDYSLFSWVSKNTNITDLIMVDYSYASRSIHSFSLKNVTHNPFPNMPKDVELDKDNIIAWERPGLLKSFIDRYDVKYILLDSQPFHRVGGEEGGDDKNHHKLFNVNEYNELFRKMPFLQLVKEYGSSSLYRVIKENQSTSQQYLSTYH
jgi:hypothetical protein